MRNTCVYHNLTGPENLIAPCWNGFLKLDMLKHDHEHVPYFPTKNCWRSSSAWHGSQFLSRTYCVVPSQNWTKQKTHPACQWLPTGALWKDSTWPFSSTGHLLENHSEGGLEHLTTFFSAILRGALDRADDAQTRYKFGNFYCMDFEKNESWSLDLPPSLAASALIIEPNARGLHDLECLMMFIQNFSAVATS